MNCGMKTCLSECLLPAAGPDVHTAVSPWSRVDFDQRMPGAATMLTQFYSYGQLLYEQQQIWNGPVYSECGNNYYYSGLTTGSGACDHHYSFSKQPWLVDFYLRKMQPISCHWSLGYGDRSPDQCQRFLARTVAFGMPCGFLGGWRHKLDGLMIRGYYLLQQLQSSYCRAFIKDIRYAGKDGKLYDVSTALANRAVDRSQIRLEYDNGLTIWVNAHKHDNWATPHANLPPSGFYARNRQGDLVVFSALYNGQWADYVHSAEYDYIDGRGNWIETPWAASDGQLIILKRKNGSREIIPFDTEKFALALDSVPKKITALDIEGTRIKQTTGKLKNNWYYIQPVENATSYLLTKE